MIEKTYTIKLVDGRVIDNLTLNGTNFVSNTEIKPEIFEDNLVNVEIGDGFESEVHSNMQLAGISKYGEQWYFALIDIPESVLRERKLRSDVDYLAMMADIDF